MRLEHWLYTLPLRVRSLFRGRQVDRDLDDEMQYHVERLTQENLTHGMSPEQARYAALRAMEGLTQNKERARETRKVSPILNFGRDARYALRLLRKNPGFAVVAILTLALGIGANSAIFSVVNAMLLRPLPFPESNRLVRLWESPAKKGGDRNVVNPWNFLEWRAHTHSFEDMAAITGGDMNITGQGEPFAIQGLSVSPGFFSILRIRPYLGRTFLPEDGMPGHDDKVVLSYGLWQSRFGGDREIAGKKLTVNGTSCVILGVMPAGFSYPKSQAQLWTPLAITRAQEWSDGRYLTVVARLKPGVTLQQAQDDMKAAGRITAQLRPDFNGNWSAVALPFLADVTQDLRRPLLVLLAAVGFLLLIACANVANLLLMRATARQREIAVRQALGAARKRIVQQLLAESLVLAVAGMAAGLLFAKVGLHALLTMIPQSTPLPRSEPISIDGAVLAFTLVISGTTAVLFGLAPSLRLSRVAVQDALKQGTLQGTGGSNRRLRQSLVVAEISLAILLSVGAGLMLRSFHRLVLTNPGFDADNLVTMSIFTAPSKYSTPLKRALYVDRLLAEVRNVPGVESAGSVHFLPLTESTSVSCFAQGNQTLVPATSPSAHFLIVSPGYMATMKIPVLSGRDFSQHDQFGSPSVLLVNQAFVHQYLSGENPLGQRLSVCWDPFPNPAEIVGVVADSRHAALNQTPEPTIYLPNMQVAMYFAHIMVRSKGDPRQIMRSAESAIHRIDPDQAVSGLQTMEAVFNDSVSRPRFEMLLLGVFATLALGLAIIGVYGVISYSAGQRIREIGIRVALGASRTAVAYLIAKEAFLLTIVGLAVGLSASFALTRVLSSLLYETKPNDPLTLVVVSCVMLLCAALAAYLPARRAMRVDPMSALRYE